MRSVEAVYSERAKRMLKYAGSSIRKIGINGLLATKHTHNYKRQKRMKRIHVGPILTIGSIYVNHLLKFNRIQQHLS